MIMNDTQHFLFYIIDAVNQPACTLILVTETQHKNSEYKSQTDHLDSVFIEQMLYVETGMHLLFLNDKFIQTTGSFGLLRLFYTNQT